MPHDIDDPSRVGGEYPEHKLPLWKGLLPIEMQSFQQLLAIWVNLRSIDEKIFIPDIAGDPQSRVSLALEENLFMFEEILSTPMPDEVRVCVVLVATAIKKLMSSSTPVEIGVYLQSVDLHDLVNKFIVLQALIARN